MTSMLNNTVVYETYDGELFASKDAVQEYCRGRPYRLGMMGWTEKKIRDQNPSPQTSEHLRSALVDVPAVESEPVTDPEPIAWYMHLWNEADEDIKSDVRWGQPTADESERAEHNGHDIEYLYGSHPPRSLSNEGLNVEYLTRPIIGFENRTAQEVFDIMADRIRLALSTRKGSAGDGSATGTSGGREDG